MKIAIGSDHAGFNIKEGLKSSLKNHGHEVIDMGTNSTESCDYPDFAKKVALAVAENQCERGILICGTGNGMSMAANKIKNVRAAVCHNEFTTEMSRKHNNANVFCSGARVIDQQTIEKLVKLWLETAFDGERHTRRINKL